MGSIAFFAAVAACAFGVGDWNGQRSASSLSFNQATEIATSQDEPTERRRSALGRIYWIVSHGIEVLVEQRDGQLAPDAEIALDGIWDLLEPTRHLATTGVDTATTTGTPR